MALVLRENSLPLPSPPPVPPPPSPSGRLFLVVCLPTLLQRGGWELTHGSGSLQESKNPRGWELRNDPEKSCRILKCLGFSSVAREGS